MSDHVRMCAAAVRAMLRFAVLLPALHIASVFFGQVGQAGAELKLKLPQFQATGRAPPAEVADFVEAARQGVLKIATKELVRLQAHRGPTARFVVAVSDGIAPIVEVRDATATHGTAEHVSGKVL